jgi:hypothetical protein
MKKLFVLAAATIILSATVNAQTDIAIVKKDEKDLKQQESMVKKEKKAERKELRKLEGKEPSYQAKQAFFSDFGNIPVTKWERTADYDKATFTKDGQVMKAYYDADAQLVGTTTHKTFADIPAAGQKYINTKYAGYDKGDVIFFDDNEANETDMILFDHQFEDADNYFIELKKGNKDIVLQVNTSGEVFFFTQIQ